jgi:hypothetical protein
MGWAEMRPVMVALLLLTDLFVVAVLAISRPRGWVPSVIAFGSVLIGLLWLQVWAIQRRHDDD